MGGAARGRDVRGKAGGFAQSTEWYNCFVFNSSPCPTWGLNPGPQDQQSLVLPASQATLKLVLGEFAVAKRREQQQKRAPAVAPPSLVRSSVRKEDVGVGAGLLQMGFSAWASLYPFHHWPVFPDVI